MYQEDGMELLPSSDQKYNLRWPDYHSSVLATFRYVSIILTWRVSNLVPTAGV